ncbi:MULTISPECIES: hypothetical protein [Peribacillus]|uniref:hypothetical protein n=1 Tax=Peribacillus TaxID=2675229 RepID=UPI002EC38580|nr:hypothetical protein [Peribacillus frigoritolerans]QYF85032.1 hypothetical protein KY492_12525 [Brevibacterium sp. PAMC21349]
MAKSSVSLKVAEEVKGMLEELRVFYSKEVSVDLNTSQTAERIIRLAYLDMKEKKAED